MNVVGFVYLQGSAKIRKLKRIEYNPSPDSLFSSEKYFSVVAGCGLRMFFRPTIIKISADRKEGIFLNLYSQQIIVGKWALNWRPELKSSLSSAKIGRRKLVKNRM